MKLNKILTELKRRNVIKSTVAYLAVAWVIIQIASIVLPAFNAPESALKALIYILSLGLLFWIFFSWIYDFTPDGIRKTNEYSGSEENPVYENQRLNKVIIASLLFVIVILIVNQFWGQNESGDKIKLNATETVNRSSSNSIAVLAFKDLSPAKNQEYFSDGISEGILSLLTKIPNLKVISSASSFHYKDKQEPISKIAEDLAVNFILDGTVSKSDSLLRITTKLIDTQDGSLIWDHTFDQNYSNIFRIQDEIASSVAQQLKLTFSDDRLNSATTSFESYRQYLESSYLYNQFTPETMIEADALVRSSILLDSTYASSWILLGKINDKRSRNFDQISVGEGRDIFIYSMNKALDIDPAKAEAYAHLANMAALQNKSEKAKDFMSKALEIEPSNPEVLALGSDVNFYLGNLKEVLRLDHKALAIDPLNPSLLFSLGLDYYFIKEYDKSLEYLEKYDYLKPESALHHMLMSVVLTLKGDNEAALIKAKKEPHVGFSIFARSNAYYGLGSNDQADSLIHVMIDRYSSNSANLIAASYAWQNNRDEAFKWLNNMLETNRVVLQESINYIYFSKLYDDPRWEELLLKLDLPNGHWILSTTK